MMSPNRFGLGYDIREAPSRLPLTWDSERRRTFLIVPTVAAPLSLDMNVWTSIFRRHGSVLEDEEAEVLVTTPSGRFVGLGLWDSVDEMFQQAAENAKLASYHWPIAVELLGDERDALTWNNLEVIGPLRLELADSMLLGYDVTDGYATSALMNMGYDDEDRMRWTPSFVNKLNSNHLFSEYGDAVLFKNISPQRDPGHAPYYVVALYRLPFPEITPRP